MTEEVPRGFPLLSEDENTGNREWDLSSSELRASTSTLFMVLAPASGERWRGTCLLSSDQDLKELLKDPDQENYGEIKRCLGATT